MRLTRSEHLSQSRGGAIDAELYPWSKSLSIEIFAAKMINESVFDELGTMKY
jgi:hypothetical protein